MKKNYRKILVITFALLSAFFGGSYLLVNSDSPTFKASTNMTMTAKELQDLGFEQPYSYREHVFSLVDGGQIYARRFGAESSNLTILVIHGVLSDGFTYNKFSGLLNEATLAEVVTVDLRGHGLSSGTKGHIDYIDQYADDVNDIIEAIKQEKPEGKVIVAGHSMGAGITLRNAIKNEPKWDALLMIAPLLGQDSPTLNKASASSEEAFMKVHLQRIIGLALLNTVGISTWNDLPVLFFNVPKESPLSTYSFNASASMSPESHELGLQAIKVPFFTVVGNQDEAFNTSAFEATLEPYQNGDLKIVDGETHNGIRHNQETMLAIKNWLVEQGLLVKN